MSEENAWVRAVCDEQVATARASLAAGSLTESAFYQTLLSIARAHAFAGDAEAAAALVYEIPVAYLEGSLLDDLGDPAFAEACVELLQLLGARGYLSDRGISPKGPQA